MKKKTFKKRAFISAIAMLVVSAIVLTSATFAWFSMSKQATVEEMNLSVTAPEGIQISANAKAWTSKLIPAYLFPSNDAEKGDRYAAYEGNTNMMPGDLKPVSAAFLNATGGDKSGVVNFFGASANDKKELTVRRLTQMTESADDCGFVAFDIFLKVATAMPVHFNNISFTDTTDADALTALRVGFQIMGNVAADAQPTAAQALNAFSTSTSYVYEVDTTNRSADAKTRGNSNGYIATKPLFTNMGGTLNDDFVLASGGGVYDKYACNFVKSTDAATTKTFNIAAGITKIRVYVWMEGQDIDCRNSIAGSIITGNIQFDID